MEFFRSAGLERSTSIYSSAELEAEASACRCSTAVLPFLSGAMGWYLG